MSSITKFIERSLNSMHYSGEDNTGRAIVIDCARIGGSFEVMALRPGGEEVASECVKTLSEASEVYRRFLKKYTTPHPQRREELPAPLTGKYADLRDALKKALAAGRAAEDANPEDGGTCNFDACAVYLPRWIEKKVEQAAREAGTRCSKWTFCGGGFYVFGPNSRAQGNARSRNAQAMTKAMQAQGWDAIDYGQMD